MDLEKIREIENKIIEEIDACSKSFLNKFPLSDYIRLLDNYPKICSYHYISSEVKRLCNDIIISSNEHMLELYHKLILIYLIIKAESKLKHIEYPEDIKMLYTQNFGRIVNDIESNSNPSGFYNYPR